MKGPGWNNTMKPIFNKVSTWAETIPPAESWKEPNTYLKQPKFNFSSRKLSAIPLWEAKNSKHTIAPTATSMETPIPLLWNPMLTFRKYFSRLVLTLLSSWWKCCMIRHKFYESQLSNQLNSFIKPSVAPSAKWFLNYSKLSSSLTLQTNLNKIQLLVMKNPFNLTSNKKSQQRILPKAKFSSITTTIYYKLSSAYCP